MSTRDSRDRAEARRRARRAARGEPGETDTADADEASPPDDARNGGLLSRIFPPAPPLPDKPDPLKDFDPDRPMRPLRERFFLLRQNLLAWIPSGFVAFIGLYASFFYQGDLLGLLATFIQFGALIAAGWFGWQRPTLFGGAAGTLSGLLTAAFVLIDFARLGAAPETFGAGAVAADAIVTVLYQAAFGFLGGWYGGYLRRRQAQLKRETRRR